MAVASLLTKISLFLFFGAALLIGLCVFDDYGLSWDEGAWRALGVATARYVVEGDPSLLENQDRYNGPLVQVFLVGLERVMHLTHDSRSVFLMRHLVNFLFFLVGVFFFYRLCMYRFGNHWLSFLGSLFLILSPRIFAHSFYNSSDILLLVAFILSMYTLFRFFEKRNVPWAMMHAFTSALVVNIRTVGFLVPCLTLVFLVVGALQNRNSVKEGVRPVSIYFVLFLCLMFFFWPTLWKQPVHQLMEAFSYMRDVPWGGTVLYGGQVVKDSALPWHYSIVWMVITTPPFYVLCFIIGCFVLFVSLLKNPMRFVLRHWNDLAFLLWFFLPLAGVLLIRPGLYDAWRHLFFVYPAFLVIALIGLEALFRLRHKAFGGFLLVVIALSLGHTSYAMATLHPYQNVHFNFLAGADMRAVKERFELDYWGLSYREALEYILREDTEDVIKVYVANQPGKENAKILTKDQRDRLRYVDEPGQAKYFLSNYRWHKEEYPYENEFYSIKVGNAKIMVVYKMKNEQRKI